MKDDQNNNILNDFKITVEQLGNDLEKLTNVFASIINDVEEYIIPRKKPWYLRLKMKMKGWFR